MSNEKLNETLPYEMSYFKNPQNQQLKYYIMRSNIS